MASDSPRVIRAPLYIRALVPALAVAMAVFPWMFDDSDWMLGVLRLASPLVLICAGLAYYYGARRYQTVSESGITEWEAPALPGRSAREVAELQWSDVDAVSLHRPQSIVGSNSGVQFRISGLVGGSPHTSYYPDFADPGLSNTAYIIERVSPGVVSPEVVEHVSEHRAA